MPGLFIDVQLDARARNDVALAKKLRVARGTVQNRLAKLEGELEKMRKVAEAATEAAREEALKRVADLEARLKQEQESKAAPVPAPAPVPIRIGASDG